MTRLVIGWDAFAALYLGLAYIMMLRCGVAYIRRNAVLQDDGRFVMLLFTALGASKGNPAGLILAIVTIALSWTLVHTSFALHYAHEFYRGKNPGGLQFPSGETHVEPHNSLDASVLGASRAGHWRRERSRRAAGTRTIHSSG